eukprot:evm.model.NODE_30589_length_12170_cov_35.313229.2
MEKARMLQEGGGKEGVFGAEMVKGQPDLTFESWKAALHGKGEGTKNNHHRQQQQQQQQTKSKKALEGIAGRMPNLGLGEDKDEVEMEEEAVEEDVVFTSHRAQRQHLSTMAMNVEERKAVASALFGVDLTVQRANGKGAVPVRAPNGVYYMERTPAPEGRPVSYLYPARGMGDQLMREQAYHAPVDVVNVTDCDVILAEKNDDELGFVIKGTTKKWHLQAANEDDLTSWLVALGQPVKNLPPGGSQELMMLMNGSSSSSSSSVTSHSGTAQHLRGPGRGMPYR